LAGSLQDDRDLAFLTHSGWLRSGTSQAKNRNATTTITRPARKPEQEAERAVERADAAVEDRVGDLDGDDRDDQQRSEEHAADGDGGGHDVVGKVLQNNGLEPGVRVKGEHAAAAQEAIESTSRMNPRTIASSAEINITASRITSSNVIGIDCS
jgi:hypothetical protein